MLEQCFSGQPFDHDGEHFSLRWHVTPAPFSTPRPPILMGAHSENGPDRAARLADLWLCDPERHIDTVAALADTYRAACSAHGREPRVGLFREAWIGDSREECEQLWAPFALQVHRLYYNVGVYLEQFEPWVNEVTEREDFTLDLIGPGRFLYGSPYEVRETVQEWVDKTGAEYLALRLRHPGGPGHEATMTAIKRYGEEVIGPLGARSSEQIRRTP